ncbi:hypothetical protein HN419_03450 [Candidatus Woesearchaeota archaeon]|jgi:hypothetical protein|nr:hypothetical protein [Candidatus Woesearchaeota archaeon]MBT3538067.1 hypothetical protein [Candidatus Woesearchaeota archaeon]MBT4697151.1 hypothetical protein [Candidatus Woesearchaeota archaeon]MBT4717142.1 hypothetical protein [Candidatus Woesearchaeota archaeon]MBT7105736.1 hypothetical protein [Candidatus Woesearchaeota archaeon]
MSLFRRFNGYDFWRDPGESCRRLIRQERALKDKDVWSYKFLSKEMKVLDHLKVLLEELKSSLKSGKVDEKSLRKCLSRIDDDEHDQMHLAKRLKKVIWEVGYIAHDIGEAFDALRKHRGDDYTYLTPQKARAVFDKISDTTRRISSNTEVMDRGLSDEDTAIDKLGEDIEALRDPDKNDSGVKRSEAYRDTIAAIEELQEVHDDIHVIMDELMDLNSIDDHAISLSRHLEREARDRRDRREGIRRMPGGGYKIRDRAA